MVSNSKPRKKPRPLPSCIIPYPKDDFHNKVVLRIHR